MSSFFQHLLPKTENRADRARAALVLAACGAVILACLVMILFWVVTGSLEDIETVVAAVILSLILLGLVALNRRGRSRLALWSLTGLLTFLTLADTVGYGVNSLSAAAFLLPLLLAACGAGLWAGLGMALLGSAAMWVIAFASSTGALQTWIPYEVSNLTFDAPFLTILFFLAAFLLGVWGREMEK